MNDQYAVECYKNKERMLTSELTENDARCFQRAAQHLSDYLQEKYQVGPGRTEEETALRDRFAMAALTGLVGVNLDAPMTAGWQLEDFAKKSYQIADAMLKAREAQNGK